MAGISNARNDAVAPALPFSKRNTPPTSGRFASLARQLRLARASRASIALILGVLGTFVAADVAVSELTAESRVRLAAQLVSAGLDNVTMETLDLAVAPVMRSLDSDLSFRLTDRDGADILPVTDTPNGLLANVTAMRSIAGPLGTAEVSMSQNDILTPVALRATAGLMFTIFLVGRIIRGRGRAEAQQRARALQSAMALASEGMLIWDVRQKLVAASAGLADASLVPAALLRRGTSYSDFLDGLRRAGDLSVLTTTRTGRRLRLSRPGDETWELREGLTEDGLLVTYIINDSERSRLRSEVVRLRNRIGEISDEVQTQRVRGDAASRSKTLFLSQLSHSLRTPLNHIIGFADLLHHQSYGPLGDPRYLTYSANIKQSGETLLDMLSNMLELAEFDSGQRVLNKEPIRLDELFDWTEGRYGEQAKRAGIDILVERAADVVIVGDRLCLRRLIGNIVENSLKFTPAGGSLTLAAWPSEDGVVLEFTDTGIGISSETLTVLNTTIALNNDSRGNGIAIARAIAELSGGQLQINSSPGIGTTVAVVLPIRTTEKGERGVRRVA